jgi:hypothetical protein
MRVLSFILKASAVTSLTLAFVACGDVSKSTKSESLSYSFKVNGCDTGKKTFSDLASYCESLLNDEANNYCAVDMRQEMYKQRCDGVSSNKNKSHNLDPSVPQEQSSGEQPAIETPQAPDASTNPAEQAATDISFEVTLSAHNTRLPKVKRQNSGETVISTFEGAIAIDSMKPLIDKALHLESAQSVKIEGLGHCELEVKNFTTYTKNNEVSFTLMGIDQMKDLGDGSCASQLPLIRTSGFVVEFENVPTSNTQAVVIPKVTLKIEIK